MILPGEQLAAVNDDPPICPQCGYDLRGANDRCSECGWEIEWESLKQSGIPWAHRRTIGRVKAFFATIWRMGFRPRGLRYEGSRPQELRDGQRFAHIIGVLVALGLVAAFLLHVHLHKWESFELSARTSWPRPPRYELADLTPWSMGMLLRAPPLLGMAMLAFFVVRAPARVVRMKNAPPAGQERARAILFYCSAPLVLVLVAVGICAIAINLREDRLWPDFWRLGAIDCFIAGSTLVAWLATIYYLRRTHWIWRWGIYGLLAGIWIIGTGAFHWHSGFEFVNPWKGISAEHLQMTAGVIAGCSLFLTLFRTMQWKMRLCHCGAGGAMIAGAELLLRWLAAVVLFLFVFPWCVGFAWIVVVSLR